MERDEEVTYLDTHVLIWLYEADAGRLSRVAAEQIEGDRLLVSPAVVLELQLLYEIQRLTQPGRIFVSKLAAEIGLEICQLDFQSVVDKAVHQKWVRDPFDRLIVAQAAANDAVLITKDENIRRHYKHALW